MTHFSDFKSGALISLLIVSMNTWASTCKVIDPELQATYNGPCNSKGLAHGTGNASGTALYDGEFRNGKKHGYGIKQWPKTGDIYTGEFYDGYRHGQGTYTWGKFSPYASQQYTGSYANDYREGFGTYLWPNGDRFTGNWRRDVRYGMTYMEIRKQIARQLHSEAIKHPGQTVCRNAQYGISKTAFLTGKVTDVQDSLVNVELTEEAAAFGLYLTKTINIEKEIELWSLCDK